MSRETYYIPHAIRFFPGINKDYDDMESGLDHRTQIMKQAGITFPKK